MGRPSFPNPCPHDFFGGGGGIGLDLASLVISGRLPFLNITDGVFEDGQQPRYLVVGGSAMVSVANWMDVTSASSVDLAGVGSVPGRYISVGWTRMISSVISSSVRRPSPLQLQLQLLKPAAPREWVNSGPRSPSRLPRTGCRWH